MQSRFFSRMLFFAAVIFFAFGTSSSRAADSVPAKKIVLYTALTATTPQIPLWSAIGEGWPKGYELQVRYWKNLDDLRGVMLAGKGDLWVGNLEGFAQAAKRGAPVTLIAVTAWKKFYFVTSSKEKVMSLEDIADILKKTGEPLAVTPQDGPALGIVEAMGKKGGMTFKVAPMPPQQLMLEIMRGTRHYALMPEPLLSLLLAKKKDIRIVASLEEEYARRFGGPARLPLAGIAANTAFIKAHPEMAKELVQRMQGAVLKLRSSRKEAAAVLPEPVRETLGMAVLEASLERDLIYVEPAGNVREQVAAFLKMILPELRNTPAGDGMPSDSFILPES
ncbi:hypothetical protein LJC19_02395 [Oxalobacter sp. OttesenSCG-928-P03]|nr:hypothetical protein [Oxalobacter sp. OttesenSCG-928-P03]